MCVPAAQAPEAAGGGAGDGQDGAPGEGGGALSGEPAASPTALGGERGQDKAESRGIAANG